MERVAGDSRFMAGVSSYVSVSVLPVGSMDHLISCANTRMRERLVKSIYLKSSKYYTLSCSFSRSILNYTLTQNNPTQHPKNSLEEINTIIVEIIH